MALPLETPKWQSRMFTSRITVPCPVSTANQSRPAPPFADQLPKLRANSQPRKVSPVTARLFQPMTPPPEPPP